MKRKFVKLGDTWNFYYCLKQESQYYPYLINKENIKKVSNSSRRVYFVFTKLNSGMKK